MGRFQFMFSLVTKFRKKTTVFFAILFHTLFAIFSVERTSSHYPIFSAEIAFHNLTIFFEKYFNYSNLKKMK